MSKRDITHPKVFISYSHDSDEHKRKVLKFANRLRDYGIDCDIDQYISHPPEGLPRRMEKQILESDFVLIVCTETYNRRASGKEEEGKGLGVLWESKLIYNSIYRLGSSNNKFIPVVFEESDRKYIPLALQDISYYLVSTDSGCEDLCWYLTKQPHISKPALGKLESLPQEDRGRTPSNVSSEPAGYFNIPYPRNKFFTGREQILESLHSKLNNDKSHQPQTISGLGGIGKSQIAIEYAYKYRGEYKHVFWVCAETKDSLVASSIEIIRLLNLTEDIGNDSDPEEFVRVLKDWLGNQTGWLLILDNLNDLTIVRDFLLVINGNHILLTSQANAFGDIAEVFEVKRLSPEEGALFLLRRSKAINENEGLESATQSDRTVSLEISEEMDGLPLALDQAAAYIDELKVAMSVYLDRYRKEGEFLRKRRGAVYKADSNNEKLISHPASVSITFSLALRQIQRNPITTSLVKMCAFLAPSEIPLELFSNGSQSLNLKGTGSHLLSTIWSVVWKSVKKLLPTAKQHEFDEAIGEAGKFSLIQRNPMNNCLEMHRLVQEVAKDEMNKRERRKWAEHAVCALHKAFLTIESLHRPVRNRLLNHAQTAATLIENYNFESREAVGLLIAASSYYSGRTQYIEAEPFVQILLAIMRRKHGDNHPQVAAAQNNLGMAYYSQGKYVEAQSLYQQALNILETTSDKDSLDLANALSNLATIHNSRGEYSKAEELLHRSIAMLENILGANHPQLGLIRNNLIIVYEAQGKYVEAEKLSQHLQTLFEKEYGDEHPFAANLQSNAAVVLIEKGEYAEAEELLQQAVKSLEEELGPESMQVAEKLNNLATAYMYHGKYVEAELLFTRALEILEKILEPEHPNVGKMLNNLAMVFENQNEFEKAEALLQRALAIASEQLGPEHPDTATASDNLAAVRLSQKRYDEAEQLCQRALEIREKVLGLEHPDVAMTTNNLAMIYAKQGKHEKARALYDRALSSAERALGPNHPNCAKVLDNMGELYESRKEYEEAERLYKRSLAILEAIPGVERDLIESAMSSIAKVYEKRGMFNEAIEMHKKVLSRREKNLGAEHPDVAVTLRDLAHIYFSQANYEKAEPLYRRALSIIEKTGSAYPDKSIVTYNLAKITESKGRYEEAESLYRKMISSYEESSLTALAVHHLVDMCVAQEKYDEAEQLCQQALDLDEKFLDPNSQYRILTLSRSANLYFIQSRYDEARAMYEHVLAIKEKNPPEDPYETAAVIRLALINNIQGNNAEAALLYRRAIATGEKELGADHPDIAALFYGLATVCFNLGEYAEAESLCQRTLAIQERVHGAEHSCLIELLENYAFLLRQMQREEEALPLEARAEVIRNKYSQISESNR